MKPPKPGSDEARALGCACPVLDNCHGKGRGGNGDEFGWYVSSACELHGIPALDVLLRACGVDGKAVE